ncbi:MAG: tRNA (guanosine(37)-N1)-methyltransferase TrmD [Bacteriovoracia bacterium]
MTLFPEIFPPFFEHSLLGKAREKNLVSFEAVQIRDFSLDKHRTVDDTPYGGGEGMILRADVLHRAWQSVVHRFEPAFDEVNEATGEILVPNLGRPAKPCHTILMSPQGKPLTQARVKELARLPRLVVVCGHYEGLDERFIEECVDEEISVGDFVLTGGEIPAMALADAVTRVQPGVVGNARSLSEETFEDDLLKYPQFTRPADFLSRSVPEVLTSGDHGKIASWRQLQREERTQRKRPDLWERRRLR